MVLFKDISKSSTDLLRKNFCHDKPWAIECKNSSKNVLITNNAAASPTSGGVDASTTLKYTLGQSMDSSVELKLTTSGTTTADIRCNNFYCNGLLFGCKVDRRNAKQICDSLEMSAEYLCDTTHSKFHVNPLAQNFAFSTCIAKRFNGLCNIGCEMSGNLDFSGMKYSVGGCYARQEGGNNWTVSLKTAPYSRQLFGKLVGNLYARTSVPTLLNSGGNSKSYSDIGVEATYSLADNKATLEFGGQWWLTKSNDTSVKAKITNDALAVVALSQKINDILAMTLGVQFDWLNTSSADSLKYGMKIELCS